MPLTPNQEKAVNCAGCPLFIQAGAGTGKTFTLTKRLAHQLNEKSGPLLKSVDNVLTITFTKKAASELLGRVRAELRAEGLSDAALRIDAAWISTIHGMCSSILSANALQAGIDPGMTLLTEEESDELLQQALDEALASEEMQELNRFFGVQDACALAKKAASLLELAPNGSRDFDFGPEPDEEPYRLLRSMQSRLEDIQGALEAAGVFDNPTKTKTTCMERIQRAVECACALSAQENLAWLDVLREFEGLSVPSGGNTGAAFKDLFLEAKETMLDAFASVAVAVAYQNLNKALSVGEAVLRRHRELKHERGVQDTNDLLISTYRLLEANEPIAQTYRDRFGSIMVDEFQDTDALQVGIIESFCDEKLSTLTTVGDAQQSIYSFRGADLETYRSVRSQMSDCGSLELKLDTNYRSHPDILAFVESIFSKPSFFGDDFLKIGAGQGNVRSQSYVADDEPRVKLLVAAGMKDGRKRTGIDALRAAEAELIAEQFQNLAEKGASYGDMALLMNSTKKAGPYLAALRERGIPCAVSGGSDFYLQPELGYLTALLCVLELPDDDQSLLELLASPIFDVSDAGLLALRIVARRTLGNTASYDMRPKVTLWDALCHQAEHELYVKDACLRNAHRVLSKAIDDAGKLPLRVVVERVLEESGWFDELRGQGARGLAIAANAQRFCDLLEEFEKNQGSNIVLAAEHFKSMRKGALSGIGVKASPGKMIGLGNDAVRIMTIHASKGLEFPIVAVAQYARSNRAPSGGDLMALTQGGSRHMALPMSFKGEAKTKLSEYVSGLALELDAFSDIHDALSFSAYAKNLALEREDEEAQRLLYVALTRARDLLLLVSNDKGLLSEGKLDKGLFGDIGNAIFPGGFPAQGGRFRLDTGCLVECVVKAVPCGYESDAVDDAQDERFDAEIADEELKTARVHSLPQQGEHASLRHELSKNARQIESYTALSLENAGGEPVDAQGASPVGLEGDLRVLAPVLRSGGEPSGTVSSVGSAFHAVAQWLALTNCLDQDTSHDKKLKARLDSVARSYELESAQKARLESAIEIWCRSALYKKAMSKACVYPEYAFCYELKGHPIEGFIDLLCFDVPGQAAMIIDYKTGKSGEAEELEERYRLQGAVYSYAILSAKLAQEIEVTFVRPEVDMQEVKYVYTARDLEDLAALIIGE